jgi:hypothetical protein
LEGLSVGTVAGDGNCFLWRLRSFVTYVVSQNIVQLCINTLQNIHGKNGVCVGMSK